jgi:hypothetical protein
MSDTMQTDISEACKLAMIARNRIYMYGKEPVPAPRYKEFRPMVFNRILSFGGNQDRENESERLETETAYYAGK